MAEAKLSLSVVVISWNQLEFIRRLTEQLLDQDFDESNYEILIVDDGSTDGTQEWLRSHKDSRVRPLISAKRCGRSGSRNLGILEARGSIIVMIDGDHTVSRDFLSGHYERHQREFCAIVGKSDFVHNKEFRALNHYLNHGGASKLLSDSKLPGRYFLTRNCSVPKKALLDIGLFDEAFEVWGGEDLDLGLLIEDARIPIYGDKKTPAIHHHLRPLEDLLSNLFEYGKYGIPLILKKHPRMFRELNLDRILPNPFEKNRFNPLLRALFRVALLAPIYHFAVFVARTFRERRLPRILFDYLHLRQYLRGYLDSLSTQSPPNK